MGNASITTRLPQGEDSVAMLLARLCPVTVSGVALVSASRSTSTLSGSISTAGCRVLTVFIDVTAIGASTAAVSVDMQDPNSGNWVNCNFPSAPNITGTGTYQYQMPGGTINATGCAVSALVGNVRVRVTHGGASALTYSVSYVLSP